MSLGVPAASNGDVPGLGRRVEQGAGEPLALDPHVAFGDLSCDTREVGLIGTERPLLPSEEQRRHQQDGDQDRVAVAHGVPRSGHRGAGDQREDDPQTHSVGSAARRGRLEVSRCPQAARREFSPGGPSSGAPRRWLSYGPRMLGSGRPDGTTARARLRSITPRWVPTEADLVERQGPASLPTHSPLPAADAPQHGPARHLLPDRPAATWRLSADAVRGLVSLALAALVGALVVVVVGWPRGDAAPDAGHATGPILVRGPTSRRRASSSPRSPSRRTTSWWSTSTERSDVRGSSSCPAGRGWWTRSRPPVVCGPRADTGALNLAQVLLDGEQVVVPRGGAGGAADPAGVASPAPAPGSTADLWVGEHQHRDRGRARDACRASVRCWRPPSSSGGRRTAASRRWTSCRTCRASGRPRSPSSLRSCACSGRAVPRRPPGGACPVAVGGCLAGATRSPHGGSGRGPCRSLRHSACCDGGCPAWCWSRASSPWSVRRPWPSESLTWTPVRSPRGPTSNDGWTSRAWCGPTPSSPTGSRSEAQGPLQVRVEVRAEQVVSGDDLGGDARSPVLVVGDGEGWQDVRFGDTVSFSGSLRPAPDTRPARRLRVRVRTADVGGVAATAPALG